MVSRSRANQPQRPHVPGGVVRRVPRRRRRRRAVGDCLRHRPAKLAQSGFFVRICGVRGAGLPVGPLGSTQVAEEGARPGFSGHTGRRSSLLTPMKVPVAWFACSRCGLSRRRSMADERQRSCVRAAQRGDAAAREQLLEDFLPLVRSVARNYSRTAALELEELVQEGVVGLSHRARAIRPRPRPAVLGLRLMVGATDDAATRRRPHIAAGALGPGAAPARDRQARTPRSRAKPPFGCPPARRWQTPPATRTSNSTVSPASSSPRARSTNPCRLTTAPEARSRSCSPTRTPARAITLSTSDSRPTSCGNGRTTSARESAWCYVRGTASMARCGPCTKSGDELDVSAERVRQIQERALEKLRLACSSVLSDSSRSRVDQSRPEQERVLRET